MKGAVTFEASSHTGGTGTGGVAADAVITFVGDFVVNGLNVSQGTTNLNLSADGFQDFKNKINSISRGRHERIKG